MRCARVVVLDVIELLRELRDLPVVLDERRAVLAVALGQDPDQDLVIRRDDPEALDGLQRAGDRVVRELVVGFLLERRLCADQDLCGRVDGELPHIARRHRKHGDRNEDERSSDDHHDPEHRIASAHL